MSKGAIYRTLRKYINLPRPSEIWRDVPDKWTPRLIYFYVDMALANAFGFLTKPMSIVNTILLLMVYLKLENVGSPILTILLGIVLFLGALIFGHIMITERFMKQTAELQNSQNPDFIEMRNNIREIKEKLK